MAIPELAYLLSGWREVSPSARAVVERGWCSSKIGSYRADIVGGCRKVSRSLQGADKDQIGGWDISLSQVYEELV
jgi:hypothetical protein